MTKDSNESKAITHALCRQCNQPRLVKWSKFKQMNPIIMDDGRLVEGNVFVGMIAECEFCGLEIAMLGSFTAGPVV